MNRQQFLERLKGSQAPRPQGQAPWPLTPPDDPVAALMAALQASGMGVSRHASAQEALAQALALAGQAGQGRIGAADLGAELNGLLCPAADQAGVEVVEAGDGQISPQAAEPLGAGLTRADLALADVGALVQAARPGGGRLISLMPPVHVCLVAAADVLPSIRDLPAALRDQSRFPQGVPPAVTLIGGPSKTGDIEAIIILGVHGPGRVEVVIWG